MHNVSFIERSDRIATKKMFKEFWIFFKNRTSNASISTGRVAGVRWRRVQLHVAIAPGEAAEGFIARGHLLTVIDVGIPLVDHVG